MISDECPNGACEHPGLVHDIAEPGDQQHMCCIDGCGCGRETPGDGLTRRERDYALLNEHLDKLISATQAAIADGQPDAVTVHEMHRANQRHLDDWHAYALLATALMRLARLISVGPDDHLLATLPPLTSPEDAVRFRDQLRDRLGTDRVSVVTGVQHMVVKAVVPIQTDEP